MFMKAIQTTGRHLMASTLTDTDGITIKKPVVSGVFETSQHYQMQVVSAENYYNLTQEMKFVLTDGN